MIQGGYILLARKLLESDLMERPPLWSKLWLWMLLRAEWRSNAKMPRGSFFTTIDEMRDAMSHMVGYRKERPTRDEIRSAYEAFAKATAITTAKTTRGMIISIANYDTYQRPENYEAHNESPNENCTKPQVTPHDSKEVQEEKNKGISPSSESKDSSEGVCAHGGSLRSRGMNPRAQGTNPRWSVYSESFEQFWAIYPNKTGKGAAYKAWKAVEKKHPGVKPTQIIAALKAQIDADRFRGRDGELYIPLPTTWLNQARWDDEVRSPGSVGGGRSITDILAREATQ